MPMNPTDVAFVQRVVSAAHAQFCQHDPSGGRESEKLRQTLTEMVNQVSFERLKLNVFKIRNADSCSSASIWGNKQTNSGSCFAILQR